MSEFDNEMENEEIDEGGYIADLEQEFQELCQKVQPQIEDKLMQASQLIREAEELAEKHGVPFHAGVSPLGNSYMPRSFSSGKFTELDEEFVSDISGAWGEYLFEGGGWVHSAVC